MQAIVLVGGFGTRLRPLTDTVPKPVLPVGQVPMIVRLVGQLERGGVDQVTLALGFKPEHFNSVFPDQRCGDVAVQYAVEPEPLDTGGAIRFAADVAGIDETFVVANGDVLTDLDLGALVGFHRRSGAEATLHLTSVDDPSVYGVVDADESGRVRRFVEKPTPGTEPCDLVNAGTYVFEPRMLERLPSGVRTSVERQTFPAVVADGALYAMATDDYWIDIGRPDAYLRANLDMLSATSPLSRAEAVDPAARLDQTVTVAHSVIGADVTVGAGTRISGSVLLPGAIVGEQAIIEDSIVMGRIGDGAHVCRVVVGQRGEVAAAARLDGVRVPAPEATEP